MNPPTPVHWLPLEPDDDRIDALSSREKSALIREALRALIEREASRRLAALGGVSPTMAHIPRRRPQAK